MDRLASDAHFAAMRAEIASSSTTCLAAAATRMPYAPGSTCIIASRPAPNGRSCSSTELMPTLRSRTLPLEVRPLSVPDGVDFLESIAEREGISYDRDALLLLACVK